MFHKRKRQGCHERELTLNSTRDPKPWGMISISALRQGLQYAWVMRWLMDNGQPSTVFLFPFSFSPPSPTILLCKHNQEVQQCPTISSIFVHLLRIFPGTLEVHDIYFSKHILQPEASSPSQNRSPKTSSAGIGPSAEVPAPDITYSFSERLCRAVGVHLYSFPI